MPFSTRAGNMTEAAGHAPASGPAFPGGAATKKRRRMGEARP
jgi:hypothetical protein